MCALLGKSEPVSEVDMEDIRTPTPVSLDIEDIRTPTPVSLDIEDTGCSATWCWADATR